MSVKINFFLLTIVLAGALPWQASAFEIGIHPRGLPQAAPIAIPSPQQTPLQAAGRPRLPTKDSEKTIVVILKSQTLRYFQGTQLLDEFKISSGIKGLPTPVGDFLVLAKKPLVTYKGPGYYFPNTKWNLLFKKQAVGNLYIHGTYWHHNFGHPMSHGCVNVAYADMEPLYNWASVGTEVIIE